MTLMTYLAGILKQFPFSDLNFSLTKELEIIRFVEKSITSVNKTLRELGISQPTFYSWNNDYLANGYNGLALNPVTKKQFWNPIPESEKQHITELKVDHPQKAHREIARLYTDNYRKYVSESSVYRIIKGPGLMQATGNIAAP